MKLGLELATALLILCMLSFGMLALVEREERAASPSSIFRGTIARWIPYAEFAALLGIAGPTLTGQFTKAIPVAALANSAGFGYVALRHAQWKHPGRALVFGALALIALALAWGRAGTYAL